EDEIVFAVIEDSRGLHALARALIMPSSGLRLLLMPGAANTESLFRRALIHRANAKHLHGNYAKSASTVFVFHDLRAESQALLNSKTTLRRRTRFVLLEDGV